MRGFHLISWELVIISHPDNAKRESIRPMARINITTTERHAIISVALIMSLRMIGLFMVLPLFSLYAAKLSGATPTLMGIAMGIYGLLQALCQIPLGMASDRFGRKPIIAMGLTIFAIGSLIAGFSHSITQTIIGRALQGAGAVGGTTLALLSDLTRETIRTLSMAIAGITIGVSFALAMLIGPVLMQWYSFPDLFFIAGVLGLVCIFILYAYTPTPAQEIPPIQAINNEKRSFFKLLLYPQLAMLNGGIFTLHAIFTASFVVIPLSLLKFAKLEITHQWSIYLPTLSIAFIIALACISLAERKAQIKRYFLGSIVLLLVSEIIFWLAPKNIFFISIGLGLFFACFSLLEAMLPSLVSRLAPPTHRGSALGLYSCSQFLGIFVGGVFGGWLLGRYSFSGVYLFCIVCSLAWLIFSFPIQPPVAKQQTESSTI